MARGDGIHRTSARNARMKDADIGNAQAHNEREKSSYVNQDIVPERTPYNIHFKTPTAGYKEMFEQMRSDGVISTRGLKADAEKFGELIFDVNSAYFFNHGGYEFAKQFYTDAYKAAIKIVGGEQYILSAVMHADERNRAMSDALGQDVYHYHLHVVYLPVVEKQILWSKRCKDESLRGTVKEIIQQVSMSKKWASKPALDENGTPILSTKGKPVLKKSYSVLQDDFFRYMRDAGYNDVERGERGSSEEHLTVTQFKVQQEQARLTELTEQNRQQEQQATTLGRQIEKIRNQQVDVAAIEKIEAKPVPLSSKVILERSEYESLATAAKKYAASEKKESKLQKALDAANRLIAKLKAEIAGLKQELSEYKSVRSKLRTPDLERENAELRGKVQRYEDVIQRNNGATARANRNAVRKFSDNKQENNIQMKGGYPNGTEISSCRGSGTGAERIKALRLQAHPPAQRGAESQRLYHHFRSNQPGIFQRTALRSEKGELIEWEFLNVKKPAPGM